MFELYKQQAILAAVNPRSQKVNGELVPAADLEITFLGSNDMLTEFGTLLRDSLYWNAGKVTQRTLADIPQISDKPDLRNPCIEGPIKLSFVGVGYSFGMDFGIAGYISFDPVDVGKFRIDPMSGGLVNYAFRVQVLNPDHEKIGRLATMVGREITLTMYPPDTPLTEEQREARRMADMAFREGAAA